LLLSKRNNVSRLHPVYDVCVDQLLELEFEVRF
jgi:hypothetical protein